MRTISLWQPWATLVVLGEKQFETRHWNTSYRGELAIHAARRWMRDQMEIAVNFEDILGRHGFSWVHARQPQRISTTIWRGLPLGAVLGVVKLIDTVPTDAAYNSISEQERRLGNYSPGRWAWELEIIDLFDVPIPASGHQGFWNWQRASV